MSLWLKRDAEILKRSCCPIHNHVESLLGAHHFPICDLRESLQAFEMCIIIFILKKDWWGLCPC